jgi:ornithine carbamoyltransferase
MRHLLTLSDLSRQEADEIIQLAADLKRQYDRGVREPRLSGRVLGLLFAKPSLRTRVSFEAAMTHLGGTSLYLGEDVGWGKREPASDFGRVLSQYTDAIVCRTFSHASIEELAQYCACPVINGLTDAAHPCQALADVLTIQEEFGTLEGRKLTFVGDGNNVARSLAVASRHFGMHFTLAVPAGYELDASFVAACEEIEGTGTFQQLTDPLAAVTGADVVYTDVWSSMGQEDEQTTRERDFAAYQVSAEFMAVAPQAIFLHCLPARRGQEVTGEVIDGPQSRIVQQAANRMHAQKAVLAWLLDQSA